MSDYNRSLTQQRGFTLIELVIIIVIIGIISSVAVPKYQDLAVDAKISACKGALASFREGISMFQATGSLNDGIAAFPTLPQLSSLDTVMTREMPPNPFQENAPDSIVEGFTPGVIVGTRGGWAYKPSTGEIWPNTSTVIPGSGCSGGRTINENQF